MLVIARSARDCVTVGEDGHAEVSTVPQIGVLLEPKTLGREMRWKINCS